MTRTREDFGIGRVLLSSFGLLNRVPLFVIRQSMELRIVSVYGVGSHSLLDGLRSRLCAAHCPNESKAISVRHQTREVPMRPRFPANVFGKAT